VLPHNTETITITINSVSMSVPLIGGSFAATFDTSTLPSSKTPYAITYTYAGDDAIGSATDNSTTLTVKAPLIPMTITANDQTMVYGSVMPPLTYTVNPSVTLDTAATCVPPVTYPGAITCSGAAADGYIISYVPGLLTVIQATPVFSNLTASQTILYGTPTIALSGTIAAVGATPPSSETVTITINGIPTTTLIGANGSFSAILFEHVDGGRKPDVSACGPDPDRHGDRCVYFESNLAGFRHRDSGPYLGGEDGHPDQPFGRPNHADHSGRTDRVCSHEPGQLQRFGRQEILHLYGDLQAGG
jgi:hypothetical protein